MNEYEHSVKLYIIAMISNTLLVAMMIFAIIYTGSLWWILLLLLIDSVRNKVIKKEND